MDEIETEKEFEELRALMEQSAQKFGLNHPEVLKLSQKLDQIHNSILKS